MIGRWAWLRLQAWVSVLVQVYLYLVHIPVAVLLLIEHCFFIGCCFGAVVVLLRPTVPRAVIGWLSARPWVPFLAVV